MQNKLKGWIVPNSVTKDPNDKILILDAAGNVGLEQVYKEMREEDTGLRQETQMCIRDRPLRTYHSPFSDEWLQC